MALFALVDFDPHGISIFRTYESGSKRLGHEQRVTIPGLKWLGICREDIRQYIPGEVMQAPDSQSSQSSSQSTSQGSSQSSESQPSQESIAYSFDGNPPPKQNSTLLNPISNPLRLGTRRTPSEKTQIVRYGITRQRFLCAAHNEGQEESDEPAERTCCRAK